MKVGVWLNDSISNQVGGGFSYSSFMVSMIDMTEFSESIEVVFLALNEPKIQFKKEVVILKKGEKFKNILNKKKKLNLFKKAIKKIKNKKFEEGVPFNPKITLLEHKIDVIYYLEQRTSFVPDFPFITTNWDVGHLTMEAFPEVNSIDEFEHRNKWYGKEIKKALKIVAESEFGKLELVKYLNINPNRISVLPIFSGQVANISVSKNDESKILRKYDLIQYNFYFYPAQFWAHKNHKTLIDSFKILLQTHPQLKLVFTGSDQGNLSYINNYIEENELSNNIIYLGFKSDKVIHTLYKNAISLIMPTFLGPTNMPLLEARELNCCVICSDIEGHREQLGDGAIYINPKRKFELKEAMEKMLDTKFRLEMIEKSIKEKGKSVFKSENAMYYFEQILMDVKNIKDCWN